MTSSESLLQIIRRLPQSNPDRKAKRQRVNGSVGTPAAQHAGDAATPNSQVSETVSHLRSGTAIAGPSAAQQQSQLAATAPLAVAHHPQRFYGSERQTAVDLAVQRFLTGVRHRLQPSATFEAFGTQAAAFEYADAHADEHDMRIFSAELSVNGARHFIATDYDTFWARYRRLPPAQRHHYEIIREGWPCHLYFDLEFPTEFNASVDGDALMDALRADVTAAGEQHFGLPVAEADFLELDSTTETKFSRHLIVRLPGAAFASNRDVGTFVAQLLAADAAERYMLAKDAEGGRTCFVDVSVYSRNRAFRLHLASKAGKKAILRLSGRHESAGPAATQRDTFLRSLVCNVAPGTQLLRCCGNSISADALPAGRCRADWRRGGSGRATAAGSPRANQPPSPLAAVDAFLTAACTQGGSRGFVRSWMAVDANVLLYGIGGNRWCGNIGREHRSNGIYLVVDLAAGLWWQRCWDPDCRHYRSEAMPLPPELIPAKAPLPHQRGGEGVLADADDDDSWLDDDSLLAEADELEADALLLHGLQQWEQQTAAAQAAAAEGAAAAPPCRDAPARADVSGAVSGEAAATSPEGEGTGPTAVSPSRGVGVQLLGAERTGPGDTEVQRAGSAEKEQRS